MKLDELVSHITNVKGLVDTCYFDGQGQYPEGVIALVRETLDWFVLDTIERMTKPVPLTFEEWREAVAASRTLYDVTGAIANTLCRAFSVDPSEERHSSLLKFLCHNANSKRYPHGVTHTMSTREYPEGKTYRMDVDVDVYEYMCDVFKDEL